MILRYPTWQGAGAGHAAIADGTAVLASLWDGNGASATVDVPGGLGADLDGVRAGSACFEAASAALAILEEARPTRLLVLGGDCSCEIAPIAYLASQYAEGLGVVWLDAHPDLNRPATSDSGALHGMALAILLGEEAGVFSQLVRHPLDSTRVALVGARSIDAPEASVIAERGLAVFKVGEVPGCADALIAHLYESGVDKLYLHIDLDVLDPTVFPAVGWAEPEGLRLEELTTLIEALGDGLEVVGAGITEYRPPEIAVIRQLAGSLGRVHPALTR